MLFRGISWGCLSPKSRWRVVLITNVPQDHGFRGSSSWTAILATRRNEGSGGDGGGGGIPLEANDSVMAMWSRIYRAGYETCVVVRGSNIVL